MSSSRQTISQLFTAMRTTVKSYSVGAIEVHQEIDGTAFFPGGAGLWRGISPKGVLPDEFPLNSIMFLGHNFDSVQGHRESCIRGIERMNTGTWHFLIRYLKAADISPQCGFYTNALVGLQPDKANGKMYATAKFYSECNRFLVRQVAIVQPQLVVALGRKAAEQLELIDTTVRVVELLHPGNLVYRKSKEREALIAVQAEKLRHAYRGFEGIP